MNDEVQNSEQRDLRERTKAFALRIIRLYSALPKSGAERVIGNQVLRSATSVGAQYREAFRARSKAEFASKLQCVLQELDETAYWLDLLVESGLVKESRMGSLIGETNELIAIFTTSVKTARGKNNEGGRRSPDRS